MNLTSPTQVKAWCIENGFHPNKVLGQNFLIDRNALEAIVEAGLEKVKVGGQGQGEGEGQGEGQGEGEGEGEGEGQGQGEGQGEGPIRVLEIGPGLGVLTEEMLKRGCQVTAIEKDPVLAERLVHEAQAKVEGEGEGEGEGGGEGEGEGGGEGEGEQWWENLTVIAGDALDVIPQLSQLPFSCMISNLPYQAGTRILLELVKAREIPSMTVLVQTEVAERLAAGPGSKTRGLAGVWAQLDYDVRIVRKVAASCFWPRPEIGSSVVRLDRHDRNASLSAEARRLFHRLTKQAFEHRRKQLGSIFKDMIQSTARAEELSNEEWIEIAKGLTA